MDPESLYRFLVELPNQFGIDPAREGATASVHFWLRQLFHLAGGALLGLLFWRLGARVHALAAPVLAVLLGLHEGRDFLRFGQTAEKTLVDAAAWSLGYLVLVPRLARRRAGRSRPAVRAVLLAAAGTALLPGCASWNHTRAEVIDPIHALLHHAYPEAFAERDPEVLRALFVEPSAAADSVALLERFREVDRTHGHIEWVRLESLPVRARVALRLDGIDPEGRPRTLQQRHDMVLARDAAGWRIASDEPGPALEVPRPATFFYDEARLRGLWFEHRGKPVPAADGTPKRYVFGSGVAAADLDGNGFDDVVLAQGDRIELFLNEAGQFERVSEAWGLGAGLRAPGATIWTALLPRDFDGDGRRDLFVAAEHGQPLLLRNTGERFELVPDSGIRSHERTVGAVAADFDGDGLLDLFLANHESVFHRAPDPPNARNARNDQLFLGLGDGRFRDATRESGIDNTGWSLAPVAADYDGDGDVDLFVGNDFGPDALLRNDGRGRFEDVSRDAGLDRPVAAMSADWGDFDGDGDFDLFVAGMASGAAWVLEAPDFRIRKVPWIIDALFRPYVREAVRAWFLGNRIYENLGDGRFREFATESGAQRNGWGWGSAWLDFDNDGRLDVYASNGFISGPLEDDL